METEKTVILDFTGTLDGALCREIDKKADDIRREYIAFLEEVIKKDENNLDWWVMDFVSRNTFTSPLFRYCCYIGVIQDHLEKGCNIKQIRVDSEGLAKALRKYLRVRGKTAVKVICTEKKGFCLKFFRGSAKYIFVCGSFAFQFLWAKFTKPNFARRLTDKPITLIDTFVLPNSFINGKYKDRYYGSLLEHIYEKEKENVFYLPTYFGIKPYKYKKLFHDMRRLNPQFLIKEEYLKISDYFSAFKYPLRVLKMWPGQSVFRGINISDLIFCEMKNSMVSSSAIIGLLNYKLFKRLKQRGLRIRCLINWFENQAIDHGLNRGMREFFPEALHVGYLGFPLSNNYLGPYPTCQEQRCLVIPNTFAVIGKSYVKKVQVFSENLNVIVAPALRYESVWSEDDAMLKTALYREDGKPRILVALPYFIDESSRILNMMDAVLARVGDPEWMVYVKLHPTVTKKKMEIYNGKSLSTKFQFVTGDFGYWLDRSDFLVTSSSTTTLETIAKGKPVLVIAPSNGLTQLFIPEDVPLEIWRLCYGPDDLEKALLSFADIDQETKERFLAIGNTVRENYFEPVSREGARRLLGL